MNSRARLHAALPLLLGAFLAGASSASPGASSGAHGTAGPNARPEAAAFDHSHAVWTGVLGRHVRGDLFDYAALAEAPAELDRYLATLEAVTPSELASWNREQRFAFWINAYNAYTIKLIVDEYPIKSIRKLDGLFGLNSVFDKEWIELEPHHPDGKKDELSLNDIEHGILRARFPDARVHAAVNCASASCPPLRNEAFVAERLDDQLEEQMREFVRDATRNVIDPSSSKLRLSEIFKWFAEDFERDAGSVREYVARYAPEAARAHVRKAKLAYLDYDWGLNAAK